MNIFKKASFAALFLATALFSCKKDKEEVKPVGAQTLRNKIASETGKSWKISKLVLPVTTGLGVIDLDLTTFTHEGINLSCIKDNVITFYLDSTVVMDDKTVLCDPAATPVTKGKWSLNKTLDSLYIKNIGNPLLEKPIALKEVTDQAIVSKVYYILADTVIVPFQGQNLVFKNLDINMDLKAL